MSEVITLFEIYIINIYLKVKWDFEKTVLIFQEKHHNIWEYSGEIYHTKQGKKKLAFKTQENTYILFLFICELIFILFKLYKSAFNYSALIFTL